MPGWLPAGSEPQVLCVIMELWRVCEVARGFAAEVWEGDRRFLQQMSRKCGQHHPLALMLRAEGINSPVQHPCLGFHWGGVGFCQAHLQFCQNV